MSMSGCTIDDSRHFTFHRTYSMCIVCHQLHRQVVRFYMRQSYTISPLIAYKLVR